MCQAKHNDDCTWSDTQTNTLHKFIMSTTSTPQLHRIPWACLDLNTANTHAHNVAAFVIC